VEWASIHLVASGYSVIEMHTPDLPLWYWS
jgi:hypothetical protein